MIGDAFHSLRSCLDLLVYALAVHESKEEPFREEPVRDADWLSSLLVLDKLNNIYKHRRLSIVAMNPGVMLGVGATHPGLAIAGIRPPGPLEDDAVLMTCVVADKNPDMTVAYDRVPSAFLASAITSFTTLSSRKLRKLRSSILTLPQMGVDTQGTRRIPTPLAGSQPPELGRQSGAGHPQSEMVPGTLGSLALFASPEEEAVGLRASLTPRALTQGLESKDPRSTLLLVAVE